MTTPEMHVMFRQYAQQMGMQNVRAILPEQIDLLLYTSIMDATNQLIRENIGVTNDRVVTDNSKIGQVNALRSLYHVDLIPMSPDYSANTKPAFQFNVSDRNTGRMTTGRNFIEQQATLPEFMFLVDFAINYKKVKNGNGYTGSVEYTSPVFDPDGVETNYFPVRIIDDAYLADTLNDFILKNRLRSPIMVIYNSPSKTVYDLYIDKFSKTSSNKYVLDGELLPYYLRMAYISKPAKVKYGEDLGEPNVDCDLPEYMHVDIVKHAVDVYHAAVAGSMMSASQQEQNARQEAVRNNYRNEGNA